MRYIIIGLILIFSVAISAESLAPDFSLRDLDGALFNLEENLGDKLVLIDFWATWCSPCMRYLPKLHEIQELFIDELLLVTISIDRPRNHSDVRRVIRSQNYDFITLLDPNGEVQRQYNVRTVPHTFLIDREGRIVYDHSGYRQGDEEALIAKIRALLNNGESE